MDRVSLLLSLFRIFTVCFLLVGAQFSVFWSGSYGVITLSSHFFCLGCSGGYSEFPMGYQFM